jgi:enoyl-CoA hydratase/carnithine racemase
MAQYQYLTLERNDSIAIVSLNRPGSCNALHDDILIEIEHCALGFRDDADARVVIWTGVGRHFSAGADLKELHRERTETVNQKRRRVRMGERVLSAVLGMDQITVAAWNGGAIGGGACLAAAMDFRFGANDCFIQYPEIDLGFNLMWQSLPRLVHLVGETRAKRLAIGGERVGAQTLLAWGLLEEVVQTEELLTRTLEFAQIYAAKPPIAAQMIKRSVNAITGALDRALMHADVDQHLLTSLTADHQAAVDGYLNKHPAKFTGN